VRFVHSPCTVVKTVPSAGPDEIAALFSILGRANLISCRTIRSSALGYDRLARSNALDRLGLSVILFSWGA